MFVHKHKYHCALIAPLPPQRHMKTHLDSSSLLLVSQQIHLSFSDIIIRHPTFSPSPLSPSLLLCLSLSHSLSIFLHPSLSLPISLYLSLSISLSLSPSLSVTNTSDCGLVRCSLLFPHGQTDGLQRWDEMQRMGRGGGREADAFISLHGMILSSCLLLMS